MHLLRTSGTMQLIYLLDSQVHERIKSMHLEQKDKLKPDHKGMTAFITENTVSERHR